MPFMNTDAGNTSFLASEAGDLIVQPVATESVALQVADVVPVPGAVHDYRVPVVAADPTAAWIAEGAEIGTSEAALGEATSGFYKLGGLTIVTRELANDSSPAAAELVGKGLARDIARKLDAAFFGSRVIDPGPPVVVNEHQPAGLEDLAGVGTVTAGTAWTTTDPFIEATYKAEAVGATLRAFVANPADALLMAKLKAATGSNLPLLGADPSQPTRRVIAGVPLITSPSVTAGTAWAVPTGRIVVAIREDVNVEVDRSVYFTSDRVAIKATMRVAVLFPHAAAVQKIKLGA